MSSPIHGPEAIEAAIFATLHARAPGKTICPSEAARRLSPDDWRPLMGRVRAVAADLADAGRLVVLRKGRAVERAAIRGVIRLGLPPA